MRTVKLRPGQKLVQIWHGCGAFKKFSLDAHTDLSHSAERKVHSQYSAVTVTSEMSRKVFAGAFGIDEKICLATGLPKTDIIINSSDKIREDFFRRHPDLEGKTIYLYCPTFREKDGLRVEFSPGIDFDALSAELAYDELFIICRHPMMDYDILKKQYKNIIDMTGESTLSLISGASVVITDYSSVSHDAALFGTPMLFYCPDISYYERGFYLKFPDDLPGNMITSPDGLLEAARQTKEKPPLDRIERFRREQLGACDGKSTERIAGIIYGYLNS
jgi:CDP-glycerol glycerophosphotransferase (TagB/SpsB family)